MFVGVTRSLQAIFSVCVFMAQHAACKQPYPLEEANTRNKGGTQVRGHMMYKMLSIKTCQQKLLRSVINPFRTAVPTWGHTSLIPSALSSKRDCGPKRAKRNVNNRAARKGGKARMSSDGYVQLR